MPVTRRYACNECDHEWVFLHLSRDEPYPECPKCEAMAASSLPTMFAINGVKSKAIDFTQKMAEESYGLTNFHDNMREGDVAAMAPPPIQTAEAEALTMAMKEMAPEMTDAQAQGVKNFWQPGSSTSSQVANIAAPASAAARQLGADPVEMLHKSEKASGRQGMKLEVVGRAKATDAA